MPAIIRLTKGNYILNSTNDSAGLDHGETRGAP